MMPYECEPKDFCEMDNVKATVDWQADISLHNWAEKLDLACKSHGAVGFIGSTYIIGIIISVLILPRLADLYGRKWVILGCQFLQLPMYFWIFLMTTIEESYIIFFVFGLCFGGSISINNVYVQEQLQKKHRALVLTCGYAVGYSSVGVFVFCLLFITKYGQFWYVIGTLMQVVIILGYLWMPESPEFYFAKGNFVKSK